MMQLKQETTKVRCLTTAQACMVALMLVPGLTWMSAQTPRPDPSSQQGQQTQQQQSFPGNDSNLPVADQDRRPPMSAEQVIGILQQDPLLLNSMRDALEKAQGVAPGTLTDDQIFRRIREEDSFRARVSDELRKRGYEADDSVQTDQDMDNGDQSWGGLFAVKRRPSQAASASNGRDPPPQQAPSPSYATQPENGSRKNLPGEDGELQNAEPQLRHRPNPYRNLPSLKDLYSQIPPPVTKLRRFGSDMFRLGTGNTEELPIDLPVGPDYVLGPGDTLILNAWGSQSQHLNRTVDRQGQLALPEAGTINILGMTITQAQKTIQTAYATQFHDEHVEISLGKLRSVRVYVVGDVQRPGGYDLSSLSTPLNALFAAGGPTSKGSLRCLRQYRGQQLVREIDLYDFLLKGVRSELDRLMAGDTILVPPAGPEVSVSGAVRRPAIYEIHGEKGLNDVLNLAGGTLVSANLKQITVERVEAHERRTMLNVQLPPGTEADSKVSTFKIQDGDNVLVAPILPYNEQAVYLDGHLFRPGKYAYHEGMTVNDLLRSYQDVMPEPSDHAEIIRLRPPDLRPETISFNLSNVLTGDDPITLQPFDVIRVFSRYEIDAPKVSIRGEVLRPGDYPMSLGMTATDLVRMAGGFKRSAYRDKADLTSYVIQDGEKVVTHHAIFAVEKALDGDNAADVVLKPGDLVSIRQLTGWKDIGASVTVQGEVMYAGTYGIQEGEHLSAVLKRVGGFRPNAYPGSAVLEREQVKQIGEESRQQMIRHVEQTTPTVSSGLQSAQEQSSLLQEMERQREQVLAALRNHPASGRLVISITSDISEWENTPADVEMRAGDVLVIPKRPDFVAVSGQVYNPVAITYVPGRNAGWYLSRAGGVTRLGDKKDVLIVRANGSVVGRQGGLFGTDVLSSRMEPGDSVVVPEKSVGGSQAWKNIIGAAQIMSSVAITGAVAGIF
jgi:protein involved in polysaccharide export with SLBB domain